MNCGCCFPVGVGEWRAYPPGGQLVCRACTADWGQLPAWPKKGTGVRWQSLSIGSTHKYLWISTSSTWANRDWERGRMLIGVQTTISPHAHAPSCSTPIGDGWTGWTRSRAYSWEVSRASQFRSSSFTVLARILASSTWRFVGSLALGQSLASGQSPHCISEIIENYWLFMLLRALHIHRIVEWSGRNCALSWI